MDMGSYRVGKDHFTYDLTWEKHILMPGKGGSHHNLNGNVLASPRNSKRNAPTLPCDSNRAPWRVSR